MRTNYSGFALAVSMGLIVLLIGLLTLSAGGLVQLAPPLEGVVAAPADTVRFACGTVDFPSSTVAYVPANPAETAAIAAGDALFKSNCAQCHAVNERVVGPALVGITKRRRLPWITAWVRNPAKVIASGDDYAIKLFNDNGQQQMPAFPQLSDKDIRNILTWVESSQGAAYAPVNNTVAAR